MAELTNEQKKAWAKTLYTRETLTQAEIAVHRRQPYDQREKDNLWAYFYKPRTAHFHD